VGGLIAKSDNEETTGRHMPQEKITTSQKMRHDQKALVVCWWVGCWGCLGVVWWGQKNIKHQQDRKKTLGPSKKSCSPTYSGFSKGSEGLEDFAAFRRGAETELSDRSDRHYGS